jgi:hypothetical protein
VPTKANGKEADDPDSEAGMDANHQSLPSLLFPASGSQQSLFLVGRSHPGNLARRKYTEVKIHDAATC